MWLALTLAVMRHNNCVMNILHDLNYSLSLKSYNGFMTANVKTNHLTV